MSFAATLAELAVSLLRLLDGRDERNIRLPGPDHVLDPLEPIDLGSGYRGGDPAESEHVLAQPFEHHARHPPARLDGPGRRRDGDPRPRAETASWSAPSTITGATTFPVSSPVRHSGRSV